MLYVEKVNNDEKNTNKKIKDTITNK